MCVITTFDFSKNFASGCSSLIAIISNFKFYLIKNIFFSWWSLKSCIGHMKLSSSTTQSSIRLGVQCSFLYFIAIAYVLYMLALHFKDAFLMRWMLLLDSWFCMIIARISGFVCLITRNLWRREYFIICIY